MSVKKSRYEITVEKRGARLALYASKCYGDGLGVAASYDNAAQVLAEIHRHIKLWQGFDVSVNRMSDPVTEANTAFSSDSSQVTAAMIFHPEQKTLECF